MHIQLGHLKPGTYRNLSEGELVRLKDVLKHSSGLPAAEEKKRLREQAEKQDNKNKKEYKTKSRTGAGHGKERENHRAGRTVK